ncbi:MAG: tRNA lysidine(34) synthetase TilS [Actinomycetota bacterium]
MTTEPLADCRSPFLADVAAALPMHGFWTMPIVIGVSGGCDSTALVRALAQLASSDLHHSMIVAHAEHDLREDAAEDRTFVAELATRLALPFETRRIAVRGRDSRRDGLEARARRLRYDFLRDVAREHGARHVLVAHTADDQAETILHRALRGTGLKGLAGMRPARPLTSGISLVRPMLRLPRSAARGFLQQLGQSWREDASNMDERFTRNFLRHAVLRPCVAGPYPGAAAALARLGEFAAGAAATLEAAALQLLATHSLRHNDGGVLIRSAEVASLPRQLRTELFVALWRRERWSEIDMTATHYGRLADLLACSGLTPHAARAIQLPGGCRATPEAAGLVITPGPAPASSTASGPAE